MNRLILLRTLSIMVLGILGVLIWYFTQTLSPQQVSVAEKPVAVETVESETPAETVETATTTTTAKQEAPVSMEADAGEKTEESLPLTLPEGEVVLEGETEEALLPQILPATLPETVSEEPKEAEAPALEISEISAAAEPAVEPAVEPTAEPAVETLAEESEVASLPEEKEPADILSLPETVPAEEPTEATAAEKPVRGLGDLQLNPIPLMARESQPAEASKVEPVEVPVAEKTAVEPVEEPVEEKKVAISPVVPQIDGEYRPSRRGIDPTKPFDPVAENGAIFEGWSKPDVTLVLTGRLNGYLEPCGCAGMERMTGGLSRRATFFDQLIAKGWNPAFLDTGGISHGYSQQARIKFLSATNMLREMGYDAVTLGDTDLMFPAGDLLSEVTNPGRSSKLFTSANVGIFAMDPKTLVPAKILIRNGIKIGIVGILGEEEQKEVRNDEIVFGKVRAALDKVVPILKEKTDFIVLLAHATVEEAMEYAQTWPDIDVIVAAKGAPVPPAVPEVLESGQYVLSIGEKGMHVIVLGLYNDNENPVRYQRVPMDSRFESSQKIHDLMALYQDQLAVAGLEGLGIRPLKNPWTESHGTYVGSAKCESCHQEAYEVWLHSRHNKAWKSLRESTPPRTSDPECVVCHVVGWNVEHQTPYEGGFLNMEKTPGLSKVGCESCHGPGSLHVDAEMGTDEAAQAQFRKAVRLTLDDAKKSQCITCHDLDNSPNFDFDLYWPVIAHPTETDESEESSPEP
ncbi:MAG: multiheme c-type cytochrome [Planctomycetia bacterium]|nr:multiheme c-type cytochrome [Planctomycetia bacterium]